MAAYQSSYEPIQPPQSYRAPLVNWQAQGADKKVPAAICGMIPMLGVFGIHKFILGYTTEGIIQLIIGVITCGAGSVIGLIEGIIYLAKSDEDFVRTYIQNKKGWF
jgi:TM2 domain-containing membrane protein YozV